MKRGGQSRPTIAAVRGAISVPTDTPKAIRVATARLLRALLDANRLTPDRIVSAVFTTTPDLESEYPAHAARELGWHDVPLLGAREIKPPGSLARVVRVLLTVRDPGALRLKPVYLDEAARLRPDLGEAATPRRSRGARARRVAIIGLGQIGGSIGLGLRESGWMRRGHDRSRATARRAKAAGAIDRSCDSLAEACADAELAIVAVPMDVMGETLARVARVLAKGAAMLDTGSARSALSPALSEAARRGLRVVGGHPLAGNEGRGLASARADLFQGATFCLEPFGRREVPRIVRDLVRLLGARPFVIRASAHDRALARTSHLPYLVARSVHALGHAAAEEGLAGPTFRDFTRVAASDPRVAEASIRANRGEVRRAWSELRRRMDQTLGALEGSPAARSSGRSRLRPRRPGR
jgi:prephenate dehydrogenase